MFWVRLIFPLNFILFMVFLSVLFFGLFVISAVEIAFFTSYLQDSGSISLDTSRQLSHLFLETGPEQIFINILLTILYLLSARLTFDETKKIIFGLIKIDYLVASFFISYIVLFFPTTFSVFYLTFSGYFSDNIFTSIFGSLSVSLILVFLFLLATIFLKRKRVHQAVLNYFDQKNIGTIDEVSQYLDIYINDVNDAFYSLANKGVIQNLGGWNITVKEDESEYIYDVFVLANTKGNGTDSIPSKVRDYFSTCCMGIISDVMSSKNLTSREALLGILFLREYNEISLVKEDPKIYKWNGNSNSPDCVIYKVNNYFLTHEVGSVSDIALSTGISFDVVNVIVSDLLDHHKISFLMRLTGENIYRSKLTIEFPETSPLNIIKELFASEFALTLNDISNRVQFSEGIIEGCLKLLSSSDLIYDCTSFVNKNHNFYILRNNSGFENKYLNPVRDYFLKREMGEISDIILFTGLSERYVDVCVGYLLKIGDLKIVTDKPVIFKWAHDIEFSEGVETVHLEID